MEFTVNKVISLFNIPDHKIDTSNYSHCLHDNNVSTLESEIAVYVGAKHAVSLNSATSAIYLALLNKSITVKIPSMIPPVVVNGITTSGNKYDFTDNTEWVGDSYELFDFGDYKIIDSAQKLEKNQFKTECKPDDLMIFSFYPTKPLSGFDGGMIVSDDFEKIKYFKEMSLNGMSYAENNWERPHKYHGYKMYMNSIQAEIILKNFSTYDKKTNKISKVRNFYNTEFNQKKTSSHLYTVDVFDRESVIKNLRSKNIYTGIHYHSLHDDPVYALNTKGNYPETEKKSKTTLSIPMHENISMEDAKMVYQEVIKNII